MMTNLARPTPGPRAASFLPLSSFLLCHLLRDLASLLPSPLHSPSSLVTFVRGVSI